MVGEPSTDHPGADTTTRYKCNTAASNLPPAAAGALTDFKNSFDTAAVAVKAETALVLGQTSITAASSVISIETCFATIGDGDDAACATGNKDSTMKNKVTVE